MWCCIGLFVCAVTAKLDYQLLKKVSLPLMILALIMLVAVLIPGVGVEVNGARRWVQLPGTRFQPSEFAKIALIIALAHYCERKGRKLPLAVRSCLQRRRAPRGARLIREHRRAPLTHTRTAPA